MVSGRVNGLYRIGDVGLSGGFGVGVSSGMIVLSGEGGREIARAVEVKLAASEGATFTLHNVTIGNRFHWERAEEQTFEGDLVFRVRDGETITVINLIGMEDYLRSVVSSEMSARAPVEFLKVHAILSRSWLLGVLDRKKGRTGEAAGKGDIRQGEVRRWYEQEDHDLFLVCADDHCQRYQGITKIVSENAARAVEETRGMALTYGGRVCDARYSKACGGLTEEFGTAWEDKVVPYLVSISDGPSTIGKVKSEDEAAAWIGSEPDAYCNVKDRGILETVLPDFDRETPDFFRWTVEYGRGELEEIIKEKSGIDFGVLQEIRPLERGPSGRIYRLEIKGSKERVIVGKELEIRRWLSRTHLLSSAFVVTTEYGPEGEVKFILRGAGWGHGVGLCQIGAAVMAARGFTPHEILGHYFPGSEVEKVY